MQLDVVAVAPYGLGVVSVSFHPPFFLVKRCLKLLHTAVSHSDLIEHEDIQMNSCDHASLSVGLLYICCPHKIYRHQVHLLFWPHGQD